MKRFRPTIDPSADDRDAGLSEFGFESDAWVEHTRSALESAPLGTIGGYTILEIAGRGGQGSVYRCRRPDGQVVALKRLHGEGSASRLSRARLVREMESMAGCAHPFIVSAEPVEVGDELLLEMEWIEGENLHDWARGVDPDHPRQPVELLAVFRDICEAVEHAHQHGVLHRDLKPSNIIIDHQGRPHVLDFGIARPLAERHTVASRLTHTDQLVGTPAYASPEQIAGRRDQVDARSDVYSLGVLLYEAFAGRGPYPPGLSFGRLLVAIEELEPVRPRSLNRQVPRPVEAVIIKALQKDPGRRYASVRDLGEDLELCLRGKKPQARRPGLRTALGRFRRRHPLATWGGAVAVLLGLALAGVYGWSVHIDRQAHAFVDQVAPLITADWKTDTLIHHAIAKFPTLAPRAELDDLFARCDEKFGPLQSYLGSEGETRLPFQAGSGGYTVGRWKAYARCQRGDCLLDINLLREGSRWKIEGIQVSALSYSGDISTTRESSGLKD